MKSINHIFIELGQYALLCDKKETRVSESSIGWHVEHSLKVINQIVSTLEKSKPSEYKWKFNFWRVLVMTSKIIPRGKAKAPNTVLPEGNITKEILVQSITKSRDNLNKMDTLDPNAFFVHPYFGLMNLKATRLFLEIHTHHHLKIIKDINNNSLPNSK